MRKKTTAHVKETVVQKKMFKCSSKKDALFKRDKGCMYAGSKKQEGTKAKITIHI